MFIAASNFLVPNATFVVELIAFLLVLGALRRWVMPPLQKSMNERQRTITEALTNAEQAKRRAEEAEAEYRRVVDEARGEARGLVEEANRLAERLRNEKRDQAEQEYERILARASADIESEARRAAEELRTQVAGIAIAVVEKVLGDGLDEHTHRSLVDRAVAEVEAQAGAAGVAS
ncbi:MAG: F0F1 ATP synthase subunit B [Acidimicrobiales bacterium]